MEIGFSITKVDDSIKWFIKEKMILLNKYNEEEFNSMFSREHDTYVHINSNGTIDAFGMVHKVNGGYLFGYSWHDSSRDGMRAYLKGITEIINRHSVIAIQEEDLAIHKVKRLLKG